VYDEKQNALTGKKLVFLFFHSFEINILHQLNSGFE